MTCTEEEWWEADMDLSEYDYIKLRKKYDLAVAALIEIERGMGAYNRDQHKFANNTIDAMKSNAKECLDELGIERG